MEAVALFGGLARSRSGCQLLTTGTPVWRNRRFIERATSTSRGVDTRMKSPSTSSADACALRISLAAARALLASPMTAWAKGPPPSELGGPLVW